ncbi:hypothetical protein FG05_35002 [Fusarium graminearum]|nr:hypothetical protein FG05_35002 [Fusarium graminearum]
MCWVVHTNLHCERCNRLILTRRSVKRTCSSMKKSGKCSGDIKEGTVDEHVSSSQCGCKS